MTYLIEPSNYFLIFRLKPMINKGIAFSAFSSFGAFYQHGLILFTGIVIVVFAVTQLEKSRRGISLVPGLFVCAGGIGNLLSRIFYGGVVDFLEITFFRGESSVFNVADVYISVGLFFILIRTLYHEQA